MVDTEITPYELRLIRIRREIDFYLDRPLREEEWTMLEEDMYIAGILKGTLSTRQIADKVRHRRSIYEVRTRKALQRDSAQLKLEASGRLMALSHLVAQEAAKDKEVQAFRSEVLQNKLLLLTQVETWINEQAEEDGLPTWWITTSVPREFVEEEIEFHNSSLVAPLEMEIPNFRVIQGFIFRFLFYELPEEPQVKKIPTFVGGVLERLRKLCERLSKQYGWTEAQANTFVLTGEAPQISAITHNIKERELSSLTRIVLEIDPTMSPREVGEYYRSIRQEVQGTRHRDMTDKHLQLAIFAAARPDGETWAKRMDEWNRTQSNEWEYEDSTQFAHDCILARKRLLGLE